MNRLGIPTSTGRALAAWPVLLALLAAALVPTGCVLWFMNAAMRNQQLAMRQQLSEAYEPSVLAMRQQIDSYWAAKRHALDASEEHPAPIAAEQLVKAGVIDSAVIHDSQGALAFPVPAKPVPFDGDGIEDILGEAQWLETNGRYQLAAARYQQIANTISVVDHRVRALHAAARCLAQAGDKPAAIDLLARAVTTDRYGEARNESGRLIAPAALLHALQLITPRQSEKWNRTLQELVRRVQAYDGPFMPSSQRILLMKELQSLAGVSSPMLAAEELAARYVEIDPPPRAAVGLQRSKDAEIWTLASSSGRTIGLLRDATVRAILDSLRAKITP
ncbi:MAG: hypothetical protein ACM359_11990, partial [Bacillota bacterium]